MNEIIINILVVPKTLYFFRSQFGRSKWIMGHCYSIEREGVNWQTDGKKAIEKTLKLPHVAILFPKKKMQRNLYYLRLERGL